MPEINKAKLYRVISLALLFAALASGAYYFGYQNGLDNAKPMVIQGVSNMSQGQAANTDFSLFWDAWSLIKDKYVNANSLNNQDLVNGAISGLIGATKDPYSVFFPPSDAKQFNQDISGQFSGIGAEIGTKDNQIVVVAPLKGSPAEQAGLKAGDAILQIDSTSTLGMTVDDAVKIIRGPRGSVVKLTVMRKGSTDPIVISIKRDIIQVPTLDWKMEKGNIAYIHLYNFYDTAPFLFYQASLKIASANPSGIILDLRDNPGGYLDAGINIAGWFLKSGDTVVKERFRAGNDQIYPASGSGLFKNIPVVVLINGGSASASEIVTGALRDDRGIKVVGQKSFGKGTVQELDNLKNGSMIKITIAHWLTPSGLLIDKNGITPDFQVDITDADIKAGRDPQLDKALQIIESETSQSKIFGIPHP